MTGNLTNTLLSLLDSLSERRALLPVDAGRLQRSLHLLAGFLGGCVVAAYAVSVLGDWAWVLPVALSGVALVCFHPVECTAQCKGSAIPTIKTKEVK
jgi:uncharacterized membrane protein YoaK (UPF0700 family)